MMPRLPALTVAGAVLAGLASPFGPPRLDAAPAGQTPGTVVRVEHRDPMAAPSRGPAVAPVTIELFFTPTPNARGPLRQLEKLQASHPSRIRLVYRVVKRSAQVQMPTAVLEAHAQGKFAELLDALHATSFASNLNRVEILELARRAGMDTARLSAAISQDRYREAFEANDRRLDRMVRGGSPGGSMMPAALFNGRLPSAPLGTLNEAALEREYLGAYDRALELIDRGVDPRDLVAAFDAETTRNARTPAILLRLDDDLDDAPEAADHKLATPPLELAGLPSFGRPDARAPVPVAVLCHPRDGQCVGTMRYLERLQQTYGDDVRIVWAPMFDVGQSDAVELALLGDAALCAEQVATSPDDLSASPGWRWARTQLERALRTAGRRIGADQLIDALARDLEVDTKKLSACRAHLATSTLQWVERARRSGVTRTPALVIGGRIYEGLRDPPTIQQLIEAELAPGVLGEVAPGWRTR